MSQGKYVRTKEIRDKISKSLSGRVIPLEVRVNMGRKKGYKHSEKTLKKMRENNPHYWANHKRKPLTDEQKKNYGVSLRGKFIKEEIKYSSVHSWLIRNHGKANKCLGLNCRRNSDHYQWAKLDGCPYDRKLSNFVMLCISCHKRYDLGDKSVLKAIASA